MRQLQLFAASLIVLAATAMCFAAPALAQSRLALLIANSAYQGAPPLKTPETDKALIAKTLEAAGYDVTQYADLTTQTIGGAFGSFIEKIKAAGPDAVVFVYFSGYAVQANGDDYLVPVDAQIPTADVAPDVTLALSAVMKALTDVPSAARIIVLDGARDGAFGKAGGQPVAAGLALMGVPPGVLLAYSAAPGAYAPEVAAANSPYANALTTLMRQPGLDIEQIFKGVRVQVNQATSGVQTPWMTSALNVEVKLFAAPAAAASPAAGSATAAPPQTLAPALGVANVAVPPAKRRRVSKAAMRRMPADEAYRVAVEQDSLRDYQWFVEAHPAYPLAAQIWDTIFGRREEILWRRALASGTPRAYWNYLARYPNGSHAYGARGWLGSRGAPLPIGYVPVPEALPAGYYDEALGLPDLVPQGFAPPPPVFFGGLAPEFVPPPPLFDRPPVAIVFNPLPPLPIQPFNNLPVLTPMTQTDQSVLPFTPSFVGTRVRTPTAPLVRFDDLQRDIQTRLAQGAQREKEKADRIAKAEQDRIAALGPTPAPVLLPKTPPRDWVGDYMKSHPEQNASGGNQTTPPVQQPNGSQAGLPNPIQPGPLPSPTLPQPVLNANGGNPTLPPVQQPNASQAGLPNPIQPGPLPSPTQPMLNANGGTVTAGGNAIGCHNISAADMKGMTDQQLKNCVGQLVGDFKRNQANGQNAGSTVIIPNIVD